MLSVVCHVAIFVTLAQAKESGCWGMSFSEKLGDGASDGGTLTPEKRGLTQ